MAAEEEEDSWRLVCRPFYFACFSEKPIEVKLDWFRGICELVSIGKDSSNRVGIILTATMSI